MQALDSARCKTPCADNFGPAHTLSTAKHGTIYIIMKRDRFSYLILIVFIAVCGLRLIHIPADPPAELSWSGGLFFDEGTYTHNARNKILFGEWNLDDWNDFYYSPVLPFIKWAVFSTFGIGIVQERLVSIAFCVLTLWMLYLAMKVGFSRLAGFLGMFLLGIHYVYAMYSRLGLYEIPLLFFTVLTMYFWVSAIKHRHDRSLRRSYTYMFFAGVSCFMVYVFKVLIAYFLPVPFVGLAVLWLAAETTSERKRYLALTGMLLLGMLVTVTVWLVVFFSPNYDAIKGMGSFITTLSFPHSLSDFYTNIRKTPFFDIFLRTPVILGIAVLYLVRPFFQLFHRRSKLEAGDVFIVLWLFAHFFFFVGYGYRPTRYFVPVIPPLCMLAARGILWLAQTRQIKIPFRIVPWFWGLFWIIGSLVWTAVLIPAFYRYGAIPYITVPSISEHHRIVLGLVLASASTLLALWLSRQNRGGALHLPHRVLLLISALLVMLSIGLNGQQYIRWAARPQFVIRDISRELGTMLDEPALIAGLSTPILCLENKHRSLYVWENFTNYTNTFERFPITHLFLAEFNQEDQYYQRKFPEVMKRAKLLKTYRIKGTLFHLYSVIEPSMERIQFEHANYSADEPVSLQIEVKNNDPRQARNIEVGWRLFPESEAVSSIAASEKVQLEPLESRLVTVSRKVPSGRYDLLAMFFPERKKHYEAEEMALQVGRNESDSTASGDLARYAEAGLPGFLTYGPYHAYPSGALLTEMSVKYAAADTQEAPKAGDELARLDVSSDTGRTVLAKVPLMAGDFVREEQYQNFQLSYRLEAPKKLEFRVFTHGLSPLWVDSIRTTFSEGTWLDRPVTVQ